jgi:hypothetical protein
VQKDKPVTVERAIHVSTVKHVVEIRVSTSVCRLFAKVRVKTSQ